MTKIPASLEDWIAELRDRAHATANALTRIEGLVTGLTVRIDNEEIRGNDHGRRLTSLEKFRYTVAGAVAVLVVLFPITVAVIVSFNAHG